MKPVIILAKRKLPMAKRKQYIRIIPYIQSRRETFKESSD
jgi:hypothetical protein